MYLVIESCQKLNKFTAIKQVTIIKLIAYRNKYNFFSLKTKKKEFFATFL